MFSHTLNIRRKWWGIRLYVLRFFPQQHFFLTTQITTQHMFSPSFGRSYIWLVGQQLLLLLSFFCFLQWNGIFTTQAGRSAG